MDLPLSTQQVCPISVAPQDTPISAPRCASSGIYRFGPLNQARVLALDAGGDWIPEVPVSFFFDKALPKCKIDLPAVKRKLQGINILRLERWSDFPQDPKDCTPNENDVFAPLQRVIRAIITCIEEMTQVQVDLDFVHNPNTSPLSQLPNSTLPDGYFKLKDEVEKHDNWVGIFGPAKYKKGITLEDRYDNASNILSSLQNIMRNDPRRRLVFGFTIENTSMRIWFCSRSVVLVTEPFNFITEYIQLIHFVALLASADETALGWDPTVRHSISGGNPTYDIAVHEKLDDGTTKTVEKWYRTSGIIYDYGADALRGRGTRVFKARLLQDDKEIGEPVVLKDAWIDYDRPREGDILANFKKLASVEDEADFERYFLTVMAHGNVLLDDKADDTLRMWGGEVIPEDNQFLMPYLTWHHPRQSTQSQNFSLSARHNVRKDHPLPRETRQRAHKVHYRIVFKEVCEPLSNIKSLFDFIGTMIDAIKGLKLMHKYNYVHRDISDGNILRFNGRGKVSDLEYAKDMADETCPEVRTGTLNFMALEVDSQRYLYRGIRAEDEEEEGALPPFRYNPLHDLESCWWTLVSALFWHRDRNEVPLLNMDQRATQNTISLLLFPVSPGSDRRDSMQIPRLFIKYTQCLSTSFLPIGRSLNKARLMLLERLVEAEAGTAINEEAYGPSTHDGLIKRLEEAQLASETIILDVLGPTDTTSDKRKAPTLADDNASKQPRVDDIDISGPLSWYSGVPMQPVPLLSNFIW